MSGTTELNHTGFLGQVIVVKPEKESETNKVKDMFIDYTTGARGIEPSGAYLFVDLSKVRAVNSTFFGALGATVQLEHIKVVALCGMSDALRTIARRLGIDESAPTLDMASERLKDNAHKFRIYDSVDEAMKHIVSGGWSHD